MQKALQSVYFLSIIMILHFPDLEQLGNRIQKTMEPFIGPKRCECKDADAIGERKVLQMHLA